tara:strand:- start:187 stop:582 length:396 start_codon:yes stop_codon:yes gene_type:complete
MPFDIFAEDPFGLELTHDSRDFRPKVAGICSALSVAGNAERLAWISGRQEMNLSAPCTAVEGFEIVPNRCLSQGLVCHPRHESSRCMGFPLDVTNSAISGFRDMQSEIKPAVTGTEGDAAKVIDFWSKIGM